MINKNIFCICLGFLFTFSGMAQIFDLNMQEMKAKYKNENIWTNENLKWYDPATGMANYAIAIFYKLMEGLKDIFIDEKERKKHILENMLYMGELNKKNCFIFKQIFFLAFPCKWHIYIRSVFH